jgi:hypothetical protein
MCTVVFMPGKQGYFFASLRDESSIRAQALLPMIYADNNTRYLSPIDPVGNGTWIGVNECGHVIILLNGGFCNHRKQPVYARSRGTIVKELLSDRMPVIAWLLMDLINIEPFTLIVWADDKLFQLVWDGQKKHRIFLSNKIPHIFSSATLYDQAHAVKRKVLFDSWINTAPVVNQLSLLNFFTTASPDKQNGFIIDRSEKMRTLSYSFIEIKNNEVAEFNYYDLLTASTDISGINLFVKHGACSCTLNN